jgi:hypothetical protein
VKVLRDLGRRLRQVLPRRLSGALINSARLGRVVASPETLPLRDLADLHETHLLVRRADADHANVLMRAHYDLVRDPDQRTLLRSHEARVLSQNGEDGIILHLLSMVGPASHLAIEIGSGGWSSNIANLTRTFGFDGVFVDGSAEALTQQRRRLEALQPDALDRCRLVEAWVRPEQFGEDIEGWAGRREVDLLSIDIDSVDYWVLAGLAPSRPRILVLEYNASFGPTARVTAPEHGFPGRWAAHPSGFSYGASLAALDQVATSMGYSLVGCESAGVNAFFVRDDLMAGGLRRVAPSEAYYLDERRRSVSASDQDSFARAGGIIEV